LKGGDLHLFRRIEKARGRAHRFWQGCFAHDLVGSDGLEGACDNLIDAVGYASIYGLHTHCDGDSRLLLARSGHRVRGASQLCQFPPGRLEIGFDLQRFLQEFLSAQGPIEQLIGECLPEARQMAVRVTVVGGLLIIGEGARIPTCLTQCVGTPIVGMGKFRVEQQNCVEIVNRHGGLAGLVIGKGSVVHGGDPRLVGNRSF
jgi:hypothetical protein